MAHRYHLFIETPEANLVEDMKWLRLVWKRSLDCRTARHAQRCQCEPCTSPEVEDECGGTVTVTQSSETGFTDINLAANGASELFVLAFGDKGKHARASNAMAELPLSVACAVEPAAVPE
jgi:hypothetical protein